MIVNCGQTIFASFTHKMRKNIKKNPKWFYVVKINDTQCTTNDTVTKSDDMNNYFYTGVIHNLRRGKAAVGLFTRKPAKPLEAVEMRAGQVALIPDRFGN